MVLIDCDAFKVHLLGGIETRNNALSWCALLKCVYTKLRVLSQSDLA